jgi:hypothetical protein
LVLVYCRFLRILPIGCDPFPLFSYPFELFPVLFFFFFFLFFLILSHYCLSPPLTSVPMCPFVE